MAGRLNRIEPLWRLQRDAGIGAISAARSVLDPQRRAGLARSLLEFVPPQVRREVRTAVDVGAHLGEWTTGVLQIFPQCEVFAFEPTPDIADLLARKFAADQRVHVVTSAVGREPGTGILHRFSASDLNSLRPANPTLSAAIPLAVEDGAIAVPVTTLDATLSDVDRVDVLKIDVQGNEADVLAGSCGVLSRTSCVIIETTFLPQYEGAPTFGEVHALLTDAGFFFHGFTRIARRSDGAAIWSDAIYCR
jgi:FkbM family methyltransferase